MEQHLGRQAGVQKVHVTLIDGSVEITPKNDGRLDPLQILKATYDSGVSVAEMTVTVLGKVKKDSDGSLLLEVQSAKSFKIEQNKFSDQLEALSASDARVTIRGILYKKDPSRKKQIVPPSLSIAVLEIQKE